MRVNLWDYNHSRVNFQTCINLSVCMWLNLMSVVMLFVSVVPSELVLPLISKASFAACIISNPFILVMNYLYFTKKNNYKNVLNAFNTESAVSDQKNYVFGAVYIMVSVVSLIAMSIILGITLRQRMYEY